MCDFAHIFCETFPQYQITVRHNFIHSSLLANSVFIYLFNIHIEYSFKEMFLVQYPKDSPKPPVLDSKLQKRDERPLNLKKPSYRKL